MKRIRIILFLLLISFVAFEFTEKPFTGKIYAADCVPKNNPSDTVRIFFDRCVKSSVKSEMPTEMWNVLLRELMKDTNKNSNYSKAWKFISRAEYRK